MVRAGMRRVPSIPGSKFLLVAVLLLLATAAAVYAGTKIDDGTDEPVTRTRADGSLTSQPDPLSLEDVQKQRRGTPAEAVMKLWYWAQWGSSPNIIAAYHPAVVRRLGSADIAGSYAGQRASLLAAQPRIVNVVPGRDETSVVTLDALRVNLPPEHYSFTVRKVGTEWFVVFDTLLESGITAYVQFRNTPNPDSKSVPAAAKRAGLAAARSYRVAFLCRGIQSGTLPPGSLPIEASSDC